MEVVATKPGFFGKLRQVGEKFDVPSGEKASWFQPTKPAESKPGRKPAEAKQDAAEQV